MLWVSDVNSSYMRNMSIFILQTRKEPSTLSDFVVFVEQLMLFFCLLNQLINKFRFRRLLCVSFDFQDVLDIMFLFLYNLLGVKYISNSVCRRLEIEGTFGKRDLPTLTNVILRDTYSALLVLDIGCHMDEKCTILLVLRLS